MRNSGRGRRDGERDVFHITDAPKPLSQDIRSRESKYLMAMGIRIVAFLLIVVLPIDWGWKLGLAAMALILPYVAVVYANGGREPSPGADAPYEGPDLRALTRGTGEAEADNPAEPLLGTVIQDFDRDAAADPGPRAEHHWTTHAAWVGHPDGPAERADEAAARETAESATEDVAK